MDKQSEQVNTGDTLRLQKYMADAGFASRRQSEEVILQGRVRVNGVVVKALGTKVQTGDEVEVDGKRLVLAAAKEDLIYVMLYKPAGVITSVRDDRKRKTVLDLVRKGFPNRLYPVGRLDYDTSGLLLLTNDGALTHRLTHPGYEVEKTYLAWVTGPVYAGKLRRLSQGVSLEDGLTAPAKTRVVKNGAADEAGKFLTIVELRIHEGRNRQVRRMLAKVGCTVEKLKRISLGPLALDQALQPGEYRRLTGQEIRALRDAVGLDVEHEGGKLK